MGEIVNLRQARKRAARSSAERAASENRVRQGATKIERMQRRNEAEIRDRTLNGARLTDPSPAADEVSGR